MTKADNGKTDEQAKAAAEAEEQAKAAEEHRLKIEEQQKSITPEEQRLFDAFNDPMAEQRRRANLTLTEQRHFDAQALANQTLYGATVAERQIAFGAMSTEERQRYLGIEAVAEEAPTPQHVYSELLKELTYIKVSNLPIPEDLFGDLVALVKAYNAEPPAPTGTSRTSRSHKQAEA